MYGGFGEKKSNTLNRATQIERQPGSAIKPIAIYGPALNERLITPATVIDDAPLYLNGVDKGLYPQNYTQTFRGLTTIREAVRDSLNIVAAKIYMDYLGQDLPLQYLEKVGISRDQKNVSLAIGGMNQGISPLQAAAAYLPFANRGVFYAPATYSRVEDQFGHVIIEKKIPKPVLVYDEQAAYLMNSIMQDVTTAGTASDIQELAGINGELIRTAGKSGTTEDGRDHWFIGMTPYYTGSVWYGYDNNAPVPAGMEWSQCNRIWRWVMAEVHTNLAGKDFAVPAGLVKEEICMRSGKAPTAACVNDPYNIAAGFPYAPIREEYFIKGTEPKNSDKCTVHVTKNVCTASNDGIGRFLLAGPYCPSALIEQKTYIHRAVPFAQTTPDFDPNRTCNVHTGPGVVAPSAPAAPTAPPVVITTPIPGT
jgi:penicillin-binding protein 1A